MGWMQPALIPPKLPLSHVSQCLALSLQRHPAKRKQALDVSRSGGTGMSCRETYIPDCPPWTPTKETVAPAQPGTQVSFLTAVWCRDEGSTSLALDVDSGGVWGLLWTSGP